MTTLISEIQKLIVLNHAYYGNELDDDVVLMMANDLSKFELNQIKAAFDEYRNNAKNIRPPLPAQLKEIMTPKISSDDIATQIASKIIGCISIYGYTNPQDARNEIGEEGWQVVDRLGGWTEICKIERDEIPARFAHLKSIATSIMNFNKAKKAELMKIDFSDFEKLGF